MSHQSDPARYSADIVLDTVQGPFSSIYIGTTGNIRIRKLDGTFQIYQNLPAGYTLSVWGDMVTTASTTGALATTSVLQWT